MECDTNKIKLRCIWAAYERGARAGDYIPSDRMAPRLIAGLKKLEENNLVTPEDIEHEEKAGGTDHPDPWFLSY